MPVGQVTQVTPPVPQMALVVPARQVLPAPQQPFGQLVASHTHDLLTHLVPEGQLTQMTPLEPQAVSELPVLQVSD